MPDNRSHKRRVNQLRQQLAGDAGVSKQKRRSPLHNLMKLLAFAIIFIAFYGVITKRVVWEDFQVWQDTGEWPSLTENWDKPNEPLDAQPSPKRKTGGLGGPSTGDE